MRADRQNAHSDQPRDTADCYAGASNLNTSFRGDPVDLTEGVHAGIANQNARVQHRGAGSVSTDDHWQVIKRADNIAAIWANRTRMAVLGGSLSFLVGATMWSGNIYAAIPWAIPTAFFGVVAWGVLPAVVEPTVRAVYRRHHLPSNESK